MIYKVSKTSHGLVRFHWHPLEGAGFSALGFFFGEERFRNSGSISNPQGIPFSRKGWDPQCAASLLADLQVSDKKSGRGGGWPRPVILMPAIS